jgi:hypothetical protein
MAIIGMIFFLYEIRNAEIVDEKEPFLYGDYDHRKDPILSKRK